MAPEKIPARDIIVQIQDVTPATWIQVTQLTSATHNPSENEETADTTTFDSEGEYEQVVMQRGATLELEGFLRKDGTTGAKDAGQLRVEALAKLKGVASLGSVRFRHPMDTEWTVWNATFSQGEQGGGTNDMTSWSATITKSGPSTVADVVAAP
jgi:hypothetical protein